MKKAVAPGQKPLSLTGQPEPPEWKIVQEVLQTSLSSEQHKWLAFSECRQVEVYTDGSAPVVNPGGPAGFSCVLVGFKELIDPTTSSRPQPVARVDLAGHIPARTTDPKTSNNRAELAGVLVALLALPYLNLAGYTAPEITIWSDSDLTVKCGNGEWARKKNVDLWLIFDDLYKEAKGQLPVPIALRWLKGHAGNTFNEAADKLATLAALDFDQARYGRLRAAQAATGREMPGGVAMDGEADQAHGGPPTTAGSTDYSIVLSTHLDGKGQPSVGRAPARGDYLLQTRTGRSYRGTVAHPGLLGADEGEYLTLIAALGDLLGRIEGKGKDPTAFTVTVISLREGVIKQLDSSYRVRAPGLQPLHAQAHSLLRRFGTVDLVWRPSAEVARLMKAGG